VPLEWRLVYYNTHIVKNIPDACEMYLTTIRGVNQETHIDQLIVETLRWLFVDEANICLDLNSHSVVRCDHLELIR
jgi:hypothetical protein